MERIDVVRREIEQGEGSLDKFAYSYQRYGFNRVDGGIMYREWIPAAKYVSVFGDFSKRRSSFYRHQMRLMYFFCKKKN